MATYIEQMEELLLQAEQAVAGCASAISRNAPLSPSELLTVQQYKNNYRRLTGVRTVAAGKKQLSEPAQAAIDRDLDTLRVRNRTLALQDTKLKDQAVARARIVQQQLKAAQTTALGKKPKK